MGTWDVFDANCSVGRHLKLRGGDPHTCADLLADMDHFGIAEALVLDTMSRENHPAEGNRRILRRAAEHPRLHAAWAALPPWNPDEQPAPADLVAQMRRHRVVALFLFPTVYGFPLSAWCIDALLEPLAEARVPVFVDYDPSPPEHWPPDKTDWGEVVALCRRWPSLPVIVTETRMRQANRYIYRALDLCDNLHIDVSGYWMHRGIEYLTERWGAGRLILGSNWPHLGHGCTLATLTMADIAEDDKRRIAGDNFRRLIRWCGPEHPKVALPEPADAYAAAAQTGQRPADMTFLDCHGHLGGFSRNYHIPKGTLGGIVADLDRLGVEKVCAFSFTVARTDERYGNDIVAEAVRRYPDRFVGFTGLNPNRGREEMLAELERCAAMGLRGIKLVTSMQGYPDGGPLLDVACQWVHDHKQIVLNHAWGAPEHMERLVAQYPDACFFTGHATDAYADIMKRYPNLYVCSCPLHRPRDCEHLVEAVGADRILFGSDLEDLPIAWGLGPILLARIPAEEKALILGGNLRRILAEYSVAP
ncbi:MAG: amidohydrolase family protein [Candidatus Hydrogenedentes bacterium]|nr:amidohydrolase family protein [Candidatus Hydrogenedentota bacterium]